jgi:YtkA-like
MPGLLVASVVLLFCPACQRKRDWTEAVVMFEFSPQPPRVGPTAVTFVIVDARGKPAVGARVTAEADMTHPGMSPVFADAKEIQPGRYQSILKLNMAGDWVILLQGSLADGKKLEGQFDLKDVRP